MNNVMFSLGEWEEKTEIIRIMACTRGIGVEYHPLAVLILRVREDKFFYE